MRTNQLSRSATVGLLLLMTVSGTAVAETGSGSGERGRRGPPPEALAACEALAEQSACSFAGRRSETITGLCLRPPGQEDLALACVPEDHLSRRNGQRPAEGSS